jgi:hypothetical protein
VEARFVNWEVLGFPLVDSRGVAVNNRHIEVRILEGHNGSRWSSWRFLD